MYFTQKHIPENTFSKYAYAFNTRKTWLNFSKPHLQDCCQIRYMMNLSKLSTIRNNINWEILMKELVCSFFKSFSFLLAYLLSLLSLKATAPLCTTSTFIKGHSLWIKSRANTTCFFASATLTTLNIPAQDLQKKCCYSPQYSQNTVPIPLPHFLNILYWFQDLNNWIMIFSVTSLVKEFVFFLASCLNQNLI